MAHSLFSHFNNLKQALLNLSPTGDKGFEGLMAVVLSEIAGVSFRLAASGRQFGIDGKSTYESDAICFECKLYQGDIHRNEVITKIADLARNDTQPDLAWVLGATSRIKTQLANEVRVDGRKAGISVLILDWSDTDLPPLAVALVMAKKGAEGFLKDNIGDKKVLQAALNAIDNISTDKDFSEHTRRIKNELDVPAMSFKLAKLANEKWLTEAFSNKKYARDRLGQPLTPGENLSKKVFHRKVLVDTLKTYFVAPPDEKVVFALGGEGCGKSWIVAKTWLETTPKPLMLILKPEEVKEAFSQNDINSFLINKLIEQTGDQHTEINLKRWDRRISQWSSSNTVDHPRVIVVIDGINQRPSVDWGTVIDKVSLALEGIKGCLIVTARTPYFKDSVKRRLISNAVEINIPEWSSDERDEILQEHGINPSDIHLAVMEALRNPRLLGIALSLLDKNDIAALEELSVSRLLFEHIRVNEQNGPTLQPAHEFAKQLQEHAQKILSRVQEKQGDDLNIFEADTPAVADGRFFHSVEGEPRKYELKNDGLTLALGFSLVDHLRKARRNNKDIDSALVLLLDPITALDDIADVVLAALTVTTIDDDQYIHDIAVALVKAFAGLQNPDETKFSAFVGLAKSRPKMFMDAAYHLCLTEPYQPNFDWIQGALIEASKVARTWREMIDELMRWLSHCSLSPEVGISPHSGDSMEKIHEQREKNQGTINEKLKKLSTTEQSILKRLINKDGNLNSLSRLAIFILVGKKLADFAENLVNWSFANALNSDYTSPSSQLISLVCMNKVDWSETREALLKACESLRGNDISSVGKWALVRILYSTGSSVDATEAQSLVTELRKDDPPFESWRLIENYCATDPCDPSSIEPENIAQTVEKYKKVDVSKLNLIMGHTSEDHFFKMAKTGIVRFSPQTAALKQKEFVENVIGRIGFPLRQGILNLREHNAVVTRNEADSLIKRWRDAKTSNLLSDLTKQDALIVRQYHLLLAFPLLNAFEQIETFLTVEEDENILFDLIDLMKPIDEKSFDLFLNDIRKNYNEYKLYLLLAMAKSTKTPLSSEAREYIASLVSSDSGRIRAWSLGVAAVNDYDDMLTFIVKSYWKIPNSNTDNEFEEWYGSAAILKAAKKNLIDHQEALERISQCFYGRAVLVLNLNVRSVIAQHINVSILQLIGIEDYQIGPDIDLQVNQKVSFEPSHFYVKEKESPVSDFHDSLKQLSESSQDFEDRQNRIYAAFIEFKDSLTKAKAQIILDDLRLEEFAAIIKACPELGNKWYELFTKLPNSKLPACHNLILLLAHALVDKEPEKAKILFQRVKHGKPFVRFVFGHVDIDLHAMAIWAGGSSPILQSQRIKRLDQAVSDHHLSMEVLAGLMNGHKKFLEEYIIEKLKSEEPAQIARAIMVAGFSDRSEFSSNILLRYKNFAGLIGSAYAAAKYAYERNIWARHWFERMCTALQPDDFWCNSILFNKIVDGRFALWKDEYTNRCAPTLAFELSILSKLKNRCQRWEKHRKTKLFGGELPDAIFLNE